MRRNIFAYTPVGFNPPFISINDEGNGTVSIIVRGEARENEGAHIGQITLDREQWGKLRNAVVGPEGGLMSRRLGAGVPID